VVRSGQTAFAYDREVQPRPKLGRWTVALEALLAGNADKAAREQLTLIRIFEELRTRGYEGGYDAVRRYAQHHGVDRIAGGVEADESSEDRERNGQADDQRGAPAADKEQNHQRGQCAAEDALVDQAADRLAYVHRLIHHHVEVDAFGQAGEDRPQGGADAVDPAAAIAQVSSYAMSDLFYLPPGTIPPMVMPFDPTASLPLALVTASSPTFDETKLYDIAYFDLRNRLQGIAGVIAPAVYGGKLRRILA
jgi:hypothetical protein